MKTLSNFIILIALFYSSILGAQTYTTTYIDIKPGSSSSTPYGLSRNKQDNQLYMRAESSSATGRELHRHVSTSTSVPLYRDNNPGAGDGFPNEITNFGTSRHYYRANTASSNGVFRSSTNTQQQVQTGANLFTESGSKLWYEGTGVAEGTELFWCTSSANSAVALDFSPGTLSSNIWSITNLDNNNVIVMYRESGSTDDKLIVTDGTTTTVLLQEGVGGVTSITSDQTKGGNKVFFSASRTGNGEELWETDGTITGTRMIEDFRTGTGSSDPGNLTWNNGVLYFSATGPDGDREPTKYVDNSNNVQRISDLNGTSSSSPGNFVLANTDVYFSARNGSNIYLYKMDGSQNLSLVSNLGNSVNLITAGSFQKGAYDEAGNYFFEIINDGNGNNELWVTQGTSATTQFVKTVGNIGEFATFHKRVYFNDTYAPDGIGNELYVVYECDIQVSNTIVNVSCPTASDGSINLTESNEWGGCTWDWDIDGTGDFDDAEDQTGLTAGTYKVRGRDQAGCISQEFTFVVGVDPDTVAPVANTVTLLDSIAECSMTLVAPTATDNCDGALTATTTTTFPITTQGTTVVTWTYTDAGGNITTQNQNVIIDDVTDPVADNVTLLDSVDECSVTLVAPTATDVCVGSITGTTTTTFPITTQGTTVVTWTYDDGNGNVITQNQNVIIDDVTDPIADNVSLLDSTAECSMTLVAPTATDACVGSITGTTTTTFPITTQGTTVVTWTYDDGNGNVITQNQNVIIDDVTDPVTPSLANVTGDCSVTVTAPTTTDACVGSITGTTTDPLTYTVQGTYTVNWTFDDGNGNAIVVPQTVIVDDLTDPVIPTLANVTGDCSATATAPTTTDTCTGTIIGTTTDPLSYSAQGTYTINWTFDDGNGNVIVVPQTVIVDDNTAPVADNLALLDSTAECSVASLTPPTATDACVGSIVGTTTTTFPITTQGTTVVTWTFDDGRGNVSTQNQNVIIDDVTDPIADNVTLLDSVSECSMTLVAPTATDACVGSITGTTTTSFPITTQGITVVTWTYNDGNGNVITQNQNVIIDDVTDPVADNITLLDSTAECSMTLVAPTATDACVGSITGTTTTTFPITTQGTTVVTWTYDDGNGNVITQNQNVIIDDVTDPIADNVSLLDSTAECSMTLVAPTATDACVGSITGTTTTTFPITTQGTTVVTWTYDDGNGNVITQNQNVIIDDVTDPIADNPTLLDSTGECSMTLVAPTATDACVGSITGTTTTTFPITTIGTTVVTWSYDDGNGNVITQNQNVILVDTLVPVADNATLLDSVAECSIASMTTPTATDACVGSITGTTTTTFPITTIGTTVVTWIYDDGNGNVITQNQNVVINPIDVSTTSIGGTMSAVNSTATTYQWIDCANGDTIIPGATNQSYSPAVNGMYAVIVTKNACTDTSACINMNSVGVNEIGLGKSINIYPNPTRNMFTIALDKVEGGFVEVYNIIGELVVSDNLNRLQTVIDLTGNTKGIYVVKITSKGETLTRRVIKN